MKMLARILFLSSFAALPLFATEEPAEVVEKPAEEQEVTKEITLDETEVTEVKEAEEQKEAEEIAFLEDKKDEYTFAFCDKKDKAKDEQKEELNLAFAEDKKDEAKDEQKEELNLAFAEDKKDEAKDEQKEEAFFA